jgi:hypothetical protein
MALYPPPGWRESKECRDGLRSLAAIQEMLGGRGPVAAKPVEPDPVLDLAAPVAQEGLLLVDQQKETTAEVAVIELEVEYDEVAMMERLVAHGWQQVRVRRT